MRVKLKEISFAFVQFSDFSLNCSLLEILIYQHFPYARAAKVRYSHWFPGLYRGWSGHFCPTGGLKDSRYAESVAWLPELDRVSLLHCPPS